MTKIKVLQNRDLGTNKLTGNNEFIVILQVDVHPTVEPHFVIQLYQVDFINADGQYTKTTLLTEYEHETEDECEFRIQGLL